MCPAFNLGNRKLPTNKRQNPQSCKVVGDSRLGVETAMKTLETACAASFGEEVRMLLYALNGRCKASVRLVIA